MKLVTLLPFIVLIGAMFLMTRSAKRKQSQAADMRNQMQPGSGVRTIGGMYATVKEVSDETVLLDAGPGVELLFAKNAIGAVLTDDEYNRIVHGVEHDLKSDADLVPDDASSLTETDGPVADAAASDDKPLDLGKKDAAEKPAAGKPVVEKPVTEEPAAEKPAAEAAPVDAPAAKADEEPKKTDGDTDAK
ncbi:preprotein translocase subunit YajC [Streptomyces tropicalis]|uniref:Preprotein translocase subunit YajC n=1 Tax=Streptomyces tropicalis TaxID=3034234 RepID=A0ABT6A5J6_9ACTN|nr:preprotein translocase subunit YajC [Streptomyces tropicalis]MDF3299722.1 preprotein translocase subunit YajC [Streptomyces tropicalis]